MNKFIVLLIIQIAISSCKPKSQNIVEVSEIKTTYIIRSGTEIKHKEEYFDSLGNCIKEIYFGSQAGDILRIVENKYAGTLLLQSIEKSAEGKISETVTNNYNNTHLILQTFEKNGDIKSKKSYIYYNNGNIKREVSEISEVMISVINYDEKGNTETIFDQVYEDSTKTVLWKYMMTSFHNTYDTSGTRIIKNVCTKLMGYHEITDTLFIAEFDHDVFGNILLQRNIKTSVPGKPDSIRYQYSEKGYLESWISYTDPRTSGYAADTTFYQYDSIGRRIGERNSTSGIEYRYEFKRE